MALPAVTDPRWARIWIKGTVPGTGTSKKLCAINNKAFNQSLATGTAVLPDCADPALVSVVRRTAISKDWSITGTGYLELDLRDDLQGIMDDGVSTDIIFEINDEATGAVGNGYYHGKAFLETFNIVANASESYMTVDLNFTADGPATWTAVP